MKARWMDECSLFASALVISTSQARVVDLPPHGLVTDDGEVPDAMWLVELGIVHGGCAFTFRVFT